jgi:hypothetical protein
MSGETPMADGEDDWRSELRALRRELPQMVWDAMRQVEAERKGERIFAAIGATLRNHQR